MRVAIVYESLFGNTHEIAAAIAAGMAGSRPEATIDVQRVGLADPAQAAQADLLVVGGPTHVSGMSRPMSRRMGLSAEAKKASDPGRKAHEPEAGAEGLGVRDWLHQLPAADPDHRAAAFDTRLDAQVAGGAADGIAHWLHRDGFLMLAEPEGFLIEETDGPLKAAEADRARSWGAALGRRLPPGLPEGAG